MTEYEELKGQCIELFKEGKVRVSRTQIYAAPIVMARKWDASIRVCIDYRAINEHTEKKRFLFRALMIWSICYEELIVIRISIYDHRIIKS
jgi:hypothetical protein